MWDLPRPGLAPVSPALAGRFSTPAPPGKPSLCFLVSEVSAEGIVKLRGCFWSRVDSTDEPSKAVLHLQWFSSLVFLLVLSQNFISLPILSVYSFMLSPFSIRALGMLIIVVLNSQSDYSNIPTVFGSDSVACSGFSSCVLPFGVPCHSFLLPGPAVLCTGAAANRPLVLWWQVCGGECSVAV